MICASVRATRPLALACALLWPAIALAEPTAAQRTVLDGYVAAARTGEPGFAATAERGRAFFFAQHGGGKPDTPACTACHTADLKGPGRAKAGKPIEPMAASVAPGRYTDPAEVEKWFGRNCKDVLGRACSAQEKADSLAFLLSQ
ncbi:Cytochrome c-type protein SHP precursor [Blastochloris viridis]|nr:Cytochrome c-type protein SHP precursor [Blastochloris viridis]CUU42900.1 Sphaeroides heme protein [Blastochloris viridis]